jgi:hypothetical protein
MATNSSVYYPPPVAELRHQRFGQDQLRAGVIRLPEIFPPLHVAKVTSPWTCPNTFDHLGQAPVARARGHDYARSVLVRPNGPRRQPKSPNRETSHRRYGWCYVPRPAKEVLLPGMLPCYVNFGGCLCTSDYVEQRLGEERLLLLTTYLFHI